MSDAIQLLPLAKIWLALEKNLFCRRKTKAWLLQAAPRNPYCLSLCFKFSSLIYLGAGLEHYHKKIQLQTEKHLRKLGPNGSGRLA